jgi:DNA-binding PadR family transcriptional regulator
MVANPNAEHYGLEVARTARLKSGSLYPILARLEQYGWIAGVWEDIDPRQEGRRPRRLYRLTAEGLREARKVTAEARGLPVLQPGLAL